jgi:hypothetical protein
MSESERLEHLEAHMKTCDDAPDFYDLCPICVPLRRAYQERSERPATSP